MRNETGISGLPVGYRVVVITLDAHSAGPCDRAAARLLADLISGQTPAIEAAPFAFSGRRL